MRPSFVRYLALGALVAGVAAIVWTAVRGDDADNDPAASPATADAPGAAATATSAPETTVAAADGTETAVPDAADSDGEVPEPAGPVTEAPEATASDATVSEAAASDATVSEAAAAEATASDATVSEAAAAEATVPTTTVPPEPIEVLGMADTLTGLDGWLNTDAASLEEIRAANKLTVVQFWTFGCRNCKNTLDALGQLYADFGDHGMEIVGVHSPEFSYEADVANIIEASADLGVVWPIALDTNKRNFHRWQEGNLGYWPRVYVIDSNNQIRFDRKGDGRATYEKLYKTVEQLLAEA